MPFRVEVAKQGRAGCKNTACQKSGVKIAKGEFRYGTLVTIDEHTSYTWKHWGCVTPAQIANLQKDTEGDTDLVDGFDEVPPEFQDKIKYALKNGHIPDEDWKWDVECNRVGAKGFRVKPPKEEKPKKRGRASTAEDDEDDAPEPAPKKARGPAKKAAIKNEAEKQDAENEVEPPKPKKAARGKKAAVKNEAEEEDAEKEVEAPKPKKAARGKKAAVKKETEEDAEDEELEEAPKPKKKAAGGRKKKAAAAAAAAAEDD